MKTAKTLVNGAFPGNVRNRQMKRGENVPAELQKTDRTTISRHDERGSYDREVANAILDEGLVAHVGLDTGRRCDGYPDDLCSYGRRTHFARCRRKPVVEQFRGRSTDQRLCDHTRRGWFWHSRRSHIR